MKMDLPTEIQRGGRGALLTGGLAAKKALTKVSCVSKIDVSLDRREAKVTFDDAKTNVELIARAAKDAGYPSTVVGGAK